MDDVENADMLRRDGRGGVEALEDDVRGKGVGGREAGCVDVETEVGVGGVGGAFFDQPDRVDGGDVGDALWREGFALILFLFVCGSSARVESPAVVVFPEPVLS